MQRDLCAMLVGVLVVAAGAFGTPVIGFDEVHPGVNVPLDTNTDPVSYGLKTVDYGGWTFDGQSATVTVPATNHSSALRYWSTLKDSATVTEPTMDSDWAFELTYKHTGTAFVESIPWSIRQVDYATNGNAYERRIFSLWRTGVSSWSLKVGDATGDGWVDVVTGLDLGETFHTFTLHYKASTARLDIYVDDALLAENVALGHGYYTPNFFQIEDADAVGSDSYGYVMFGPVVPEPMTLVMLAAGGVAMLRKRA